MDLHLNINIIAQAYFKVYAKVLDLLIVIQKSILIIAESISFYMQIKRSILLN